MALRELERLEGDSTTPLPPRLQLRPRLMRRDRSSGRCGIEQDAETRATAMADAAAAAVAAAAMAEAEAKTAKTKPAANL